MQTNLRTSCLLHYDGEITFENSQWQPFGIVNFTFFLVWDINNVLTFYYLHILNNCFSSSKQWFGKNKEQATEEFYNFYDNQVKHTLKHAEKATSGRSIAILNIRLQSDEKQIQIKPKRSMNDTEILITVLLYNSPAPHRSWFAYSIGFNQ